MTQEDFLQDYGTLIIGSRVLGFGLEGQLPVLKIEHEEKPIEIIFHIDCRIDSNKPELNQLINQLEPLDQDVYYIGYFIAVNRNKILSTSFIDKGNLVLTFENKIELTFKLIDEWIEPLNVSVLENKKHIKGCMFLNDGTID